MPRQPYTTQVSARALDSSTPLRTANTDPIIYGAGIAKAKMGVADALGGVADAAESIHIDMKRKEREGQLADKVAQANYTARELQLRNEAPADGTGYAARVKVDYQDWVQEQADAIDDPVVRREFKTRQLSELDGIMTRAAQFEATSKAENNKLQANTSLNAVQNKINQDPTQFDSFVQQGYDVIDAQSGLPAGVKAEMKNTFKYDAAKRRFQGMLGAAKTKQDFVNIQNDMNGKTGRDWSAELLPADRQTLLNEIETSQKAITSAAKSNATAALATQEERTKNVSLIPPDELKDTQLLAREAADPAVAQRTARLMRDQEIIRVERRLPPAEMRSRVKQAKQQSVLPPEASDAIGEASQTFGVSTAYLTSTLDKEYGAYLKPKEGEAVDFGKATGILDEQGKPTSSAVGAYQFTEGTWLETIKDPSVSAAVASATGKDLSGMTEAQLLELRKDVKASTIGAAAFAAQNKATVERNLGRPINDAELYMAHFMGPHEGGATTFLQMYKDNPDEIASGFMPAAARANPSVFYWDPKTKENPKTVGEIYSGIADNFAIAETRIAYEDNDLRERMIKATEAKLASDPISHAVEVGSHTVIPLSEEGGFEARGTASRSIAEYYSIPVTEMKPFTQDEAASIKAQIDSGDTDDNLQLMAAIQQMGKEPSRAALLQIGQKDRVFAHAADLYLEGDSSVAGDIIRGRKRLEENPEIKNQIGATEADLSASFQSASGGAFDNITPERRQAIQDSAAAYYIQKSADSNSLGRFDKKRYEAAVRAVAGGEQTVGEVNGALTFLPRGLDADTMESAIERMTIEDYIAMSGDGKAPRYADGNVVDPQDIQDEVTLQAIGAGQYRMMLDDGTLLSTGDVGTTGRPLAYIFKPDVEKIARIATRLSERQKARQQAQANFNPMRM